MAHISLPLAVSLSPSIWPVVPTMEILPEIDAAVSVCCVRSNAILMGTNNVDRKSGVGERPGSELSLPAHLLRLWRSCKLRQMGSQRLQNRPQHARPGQARPSKHPNAQMRPVFVETAQGSTRGAPV